MRQFLNKEVKRFLVVDRVIQEEVRAQTFPENKIDALFTQSDIFRYKKDILIEIESRIFPNSLIFFLGF